MNLGQAIKDYIRHAIQTTAKQTRQETIYTHLGWRKINNKLVYLSNNCSIGSDENINVELEGKLNNYCFIDTTNRDVKKDVTNTLELLNIDFAPHKVIFPLIAIAFLSPLNYFLKLADIEPKLVVFLVGKTGARKSTLASLILSFFGNFTNTDLPLSFRDTANSIITQTFLLKDTLTVIDDYHPSTKLDEQNMNKTAQMIMRAYGDRVGRNRLKSDSTLMSSKPPRGNVIITGEYPPDISESGTARYIAVDLHKEDINTTLLTELQEIARNGSFKVTMSEYIKFILKLNSDDKELNKFADNLRDVFLSERESFTKNLEEQAIDFHSRIPETLAWLSTGFNLFLMFLLVEKYIDDNKNKELSNEFENVLLQLAIEQSKSIVEDKPSMKFLTKLNSLLNSTTARVYSTKDSMYAGGDGFIGYEDDTYYYLLTDITHKMVKKLCDEQGELFSISIKSLLKNLAEENLIETEKDKNTKVIRINGKPQRLLWLKKSALVSITE